MNKPEQISAALNRVEGDAPRGTSRTDRRPWVGLRVDLHTTPAGDVEIAPLSDHRLNIHAGPPVWASCRSRPSRRVRYSRGDVDILPAGQSGTVVEDQPATSLVVQVPKSLLCRAAEEMGLDPDRTGLEPRHQLRDPQIEHIAWALEAERRAGAPNGLLYADSLGMALSVHLLGRYAAPLAVRHGLTKRQLLRVIDYIEEHLDQNLSLARLAGVAEMSASHLKTLFKVSKGLPLHEYVIQRRVERAKVLLLRGELPASQVALEAGFSHQSHMARCMRRILGMTPTAVVRRGQ